MKLETLCFQSVLYVNFYTTAQFGLGILTFQCYMCISILWGRRMYSFVACYNRIIIDHASLTRRYYYCHSPISSSTPAEQGDSAETTVRYTITNQCRNRTHNSILVLYKERRWRQIKDLTRIEEGKALMPSIDTGQLIRRPRKWHDCFLGWTLLDLSTTGGEKRHYWTVRRRENERLAHDLCR